MDMMLFALLNRKINGLASGIDFATVDKQTITFTMKDGSQQIMHFPTPSDGKNGKDGSDGKNGSSVTDLDIRLVKNEYHLFCTITNYDGSIKELDAGIIPNANISGGQSLNYSDTKPTTIGKLGDIVFNNNPKPNGYVGWIYSTLGWLTFGNIEGITSKEFTLSDGSYFMINDGQGGSTPFLYNGNTI